MTSVLGALAGGLLAAGLLLLHTGISPAPRTASRPTGRLRGAQRRLRTGLAAPVAGESPAAQDQRRRLVRVGGAAAAGALVLAATRWPVAAGFTVLGWLFLPQVLGTGKQAARTLDRLQGLAEWSRLLATLLAAGNALEEALRASARTAPPSVSREVGLLVARLQARSDPAGTLLDFADDLDDPVGDQVAAALTLALSRRGKGTAELLTRLADTVAEQVAMRRTVLAEQASPRSTARNVTAVTLATIVGLVVLKRGFLAAYDTAQGQLVLLIIGCAFAGCFAWMGRLASVRPPARFLAAPAPGQRPIRGRSAVSGAALPSTPGAPSGWTAPAGGAR